MVNAPPNNGDTSNGVDELSNLLLQGWTMLAEVCPRVGCHMPLMRSRQGRTVCCTCRADIITAPSDTTTTTTTTTTPRPNGNPSEPPRTSPEQNGPVAAPTAPDARAATKPPTAQPKSEKPAGNDAATTGTASTSNPHAEQSASTTERTVVRAGAPRSDAPSRDAMSSALGDKLLAGWTLLSEACSQCSTPLVRNSDGRILCVACGSVSEGRSAGGLARSSLPGGPEAAREGTRAVVPDSGRARAVVSDSGRAVAGGMSLGVGRARGEVRNVQALEAGSRESAPVGDNDIEEELRLAEEAAARTLRDLRGRLAETTDVQCQQLVCGAIVEAANAIAACRKARRCSLRV